MTPWPELTAEQKAELERMRLRRQREMLDAAIDRLTAEPPHYATESILWPHYTRGWPSTGWLWTLPVGV